ncbi:hypothetical protein PybrP1_006629 [[Pythium] brassicae (nom. inval.)]|nr:hypothetical protein PybrP1_006629 [[Pythium] brassicae (nom. inval.)]
MARRRRSARFAAAVAALALVCVVTIVCFHHSFAPDSRVTRAFRSIRGRFATDTLFLRRGDNNPTHETARTDQLLAMDCPGRPADARELMTPQLKAQLERRPVDCLAPTVHVHLLWIGDLEAAPKDRSEYLIQGYNLTVHTDANEILDGFQPFVKRAYRKALPSVVAHDFLKLALLYKFGGFSVDADTSPVVPASEIRLPTGCELLLGKEMHLHRRTPKPVYRESGDNDYGYSRPFQILNWAMVAAEPRNPHVKWLLQAAMMHFFGLRDMEKAFIQDVAGSGLITDYVAYLHEREGRSFPLVFEDFGYVPVDGLCVADDLLDSKWVRRSVVHDEEECEGDRGLSAPSDAKVLPPLVFLDDRRRSKVQLNSMQQEPHDAPPKSPRTATQPRAQGSTRSLYQNTLSSSEFHSSTPALVTTIVTSAAEPTASARVADVSPRMIRQKTFVAGARRATVSADGVSHHALERLGVNADILRKEKGMKKLGISDVDIERSEELRRYTGIATKRMGRNKVELVFGFTGEQLQRDKAVKRLGTSEQEIFDDYCRRVSLLGVHEQPMTSF